MIGRGQNREVQAAVGVIDEKISDVEGVGVVEHGALSTRNGIGGGQLEVVKHVAELQIQVGKANLIAFTRKARRQVNRNDSFADTGRRAEYADNYTASFY